MGPRAYRRKKTKRRPKAKRRYKRTRDDEGIVERLVLKEVCKIKGASENEEKAC
jgi:hypothetical protein